MNRLVAIAIALVAITFAALASTRDQQLEISMIRQEAEGGAPGAQLLYGLALLQGRYGLKADPAEAVSWLRRSGRDGNTYAQLVLGNCYADGTGVKADAVRAVDWWRKAAKAGNSEAQTRLGQAYLDGAGIEHDAHQAIDWLSRAADNGNAHAEYLIGKMYHEGYVVAQDLSLAQDWLSRAAGKGHSEAVNLLAVVNHLIKSTTLVSRSSLPEIMEKAKQGDPQAQYELGMRYKIGGEQIEADQAKARSWLTRAAENGNLLAMKVLADAYTRGTMGLPKETEKADYWREKSRGRR